MRWRALADVVHALWVHLQPPFSGVSLLCICIPPLSDIVCSQFGGFLQHSSPEAEIYEKHRKSRKSNPCSGTAFLEESLKMHGGGGQERGGLSSCMAMPTCVRWRNAAAPSLTLHLLNVCAGARGQGGLLAALVAFRPPQVSRKTCNMLAQPLHAASLHVIE